MMEDKTVGLERVNGLLTEQILKRTTETGSFTTAIPGFKLIRRVASNDFRVFYKPFIGLTVQGFKRTIIGKEEYYYGAYHCFVAGIDMPSESYITSATPEKPFLALSLELDRGLVGSLSSEMSPQKTCTVAKSVAVMPVDLKVMAAFLRLVALLDEPDSIHIIAPMLVKEIHYRLLAGPQGGWLKTICSSAQQAIRLPKP